ncbi:MAG: hypothetical protein IJO38_01640 [Akkermansia sp.]|nr:hypothetical protein [Akkermansia sp.]
MKLLASLFRVVFSIIVLLALACYLQNAPTIGLANFCESISAEQLLSMLSGFNAVSVLFVIILLLGMLPFTRVLEAVWNVAFCASVLALLAIGLYEIGGPFIALPKALYNNDAVIQLYQSVSSYEVPVALTLLIFIAGWFCASACGRVAITAVVSFGLWYAITSFFTYAVQLWANSETPRMPEALHMVQSTPWIVAAVPGAFFLIYALFMAFFETFIQTKAAKVSEKVDDEKKDADKKPADSKQPAAEVEKEAPKQAEEDKKPAPKPAAPATKSQPVLKVAQQSPAQPRKLKLDTPATPVKAETEQKQEPTQAKPDTEKDEKKPAQPEDKPTEEKPAGEPEPAAPAPEPSATAEEKSDSAPKETEAKPEPPPADIENKA